MRKTQATLRKKRVAWKSWLLFFVRQKEDLHAKIHIEQKRVETSSPLAAAVPRLLDDAERLPLAEAVKATGANRNTLKVGMTELVDSGLLRRHGCGRGVYYTKGDEERKV